MSERLTDEELAQWQDVLDRTDAQHFGQPGFWNAREPATGIQLRTAKLRSLVSEVRAARELLADMEKSLLLYKADRAEFRDQLMEARELLAELEWAGEQSDVASLHSWTCCPSCKAPTQHGGKPGWHDPGCKLAAALGREVKP